MWSKCSFCFASAAILNSLTVLRRRHSEAIARSIYNIQFKSFISQRWVTSGSKSMFTFLLFVCFYTYLPTHRASFIKKLQIQLYNKSLWRKSFTSSLVPVVKRVWPGSTVMKWHCNFQVTSTGLWSTWDGFSIHLLQSQFTPWAAELQMAEHCSFSWCSPASGPTGTIQTKEIFRLRSNFLQRTGDWKCQESFSKYRNPLCKMWEQQALL